ncbi:polymer-forming cytoskeletal protein [Glaciimonas sp. Gout2]|uniref:bactofilin family protein n=1 Tax=unclassified Glaciimonas TaxID=2644401 RepID=UPI002B22F7E8|nr:MULTISPECIES: polymer-forming cytoskeletal protein [unclassified Glaciimonas]MEB0011067.1 polymer-forming cytoskeletal protein [Glaciimonas sp. Cout2]MEB0081256.1 polymer-forming cytoskeletal protein [Glaciimonas sp. Gout2]
MLRSETLFGKRETPTPTSPLSATNNLSPNSPSSFPKAGNQVGSPGNSMLSSQHSNASSTSEGGSKLIVGPNIKLKGVEITDCDTLVVEGRVEATMNSRVIHIAEKGAFIGSAEIDLAEIHGEFNGDLTVREKLVIYATGKVSGKIRYGKVVIEEGGQLIGEVQVGTASAKVAPPVAIASSSV